MCGIAGMIDLSGQRMPPPDMLRRMADAIIHRGPDEDGFLERPGLGFANRRLSIVGLADGRQPIYNEDRSIAVVFNGEFFDYPETRRLLEGRGHRFATHCDTELIPHLWEDHQEGMFEYLRGQFAIALWDSRRRQIILARDRFGICPFFWSRQATPGGDWLLFGSEIKSLLASGMVTPRADVRGLDQVFNFFAVPGPATCFQGVQALQPGHFLKLHLDSSPVRIEKKAYWQIEFPDQGQEDYGHDAKKVVDGFDDVLLQAVDRRLRADVPVVSYLSGGIDSSIVVAMAAKIRGTSIPTFTIQIKTPHLDETTEAAVVSRHIGSKPIVLPVGDDEVLSTYPELIRAAEAPVIDTSCTALLLLARKVHEHGYKVALTGEGSDEWLAGYGWYKAHRLLGMLDVFPGLKPSRLLRRLAVKLLSGPRGAYDYIRGVERTIGYHSAFQDIYSVMGVNRLRFFSEDTLTRLGDYSPYLDLEPDLDRINRWHPLNRSFYWAGRIHLPGHLLSLKGDRIAMNSSVETRYPFLDEKVFDYLAKIHPRWKMRGLREKWILRKTGERYLPYEVAWRKKGMFRAPLDSFFSHRVPAFVKQLLSEESLRKTGYFNIEAVNYWRHILEHGRLKMTERSSVELGLVGVVTTQLWHHTFIDSSLADIPGGWNRPAAPMQMEVAAS